MKNNEIRHVFMYLFNEMMYIIMGNNVITRIVFKSDKN